MQTEILITREDGKQTCMDVSPALVSLLCDTLDVGADAFGSGDTGADEDTENEAWTFIGELKEFRDEPAWEPADQVRAINAKIQSAITLLTSAGYQVAIPAATT